MSEAETETPELQELTEREIEVESVLLTFTIRVNEVETLGEALDVAALSIARNGLNSFHILAEEANQNPDRRSWIVYGGHVADTQVSAAGALAAALDAEERIDEEDEKGERESD